MNAYGLVGDSMSLNTPNRLCPRIKGNCCGEEDQRIIQAYWKTDERHMELYYGLVLNMFRYMMGYFPQYSNMAIEILLKYESENGIDHKTKKKTASAAPKKAGPEGSTTPSEGDVHLDNGISISNRVRKQWTLDFDKLHFRVKSKRFCYDAAMKMLKQDFVDPQKAMEFFRLLSEKIEFMTNARKGFYCSLCAARNKKHIITRSFFLRWIGKDTIIFAKEFCQIIYAETFTTVYHIWKSLNPFLKNLNRMLTCVEPLGTKDVDTGTGTGASGVAPGHPPKFAINWEASNPIKALPPNQKILFENPLNIDDSLKMEICYNSDPNAFLFMIRCQFYCRKFKMTKPDNLIDHDLDAVRRVYENLIQYEFALYSANNDIFESDVTALKKNVKALTAAMGPNRNFFRSYSPTMKFENYFTLFDTDNEAVNPMKDADDTTLRFRFLWEGATRAVVVVVALALWI
jgi:hypothetical protein